MRVRQLTPRRLGALALTPAAAMAVHQLRYMLAFGGGAGAELARQGHQYLHTMAPWVVLLVAAVAGTFLRALGRALRGHTSLPRYTYSLAGLWLACTACLLGIFVFQELLEGVLATGHPAGLAGVLGYGGWWAIPAAACVGLVLAVVLHGARWVLDEVARRARRRSRSRAAITAAACAPPVSWAPRPAPLAAGWSRRGPPR